MIQTDIALNPMAGTSPRAPGCQEDNCADPFCGCAPPSTHARAHVSTPTVGLGKINTSILALDLGTKCGYACKPRDGALIHGTQVFTPRASWSAGQKWQRFRAWLSTMIFERQITVIAFEDVKRHGPGQVLAAHAYGGYRAMLEMVADQHRVELRPVGVGTIKKQWTGNGHAKKEEMIAQAKKRGFRVEDDNDADALAILHWALAKEAA